ncbi:MAG: hypothetical protein P8123_06010, partial [bacterium]
PDIAVLDQWIIDLWDIDGQSADTTTGDYDGSDWSWTPSTGYDIWPGLPFIVKPTDKSDKARSITWP